MQDNPESPSKRLSFFGDKGFFSHEEENPDAMEMEEFAEQLIQREHDYSPTRKISDQGSYVKPLNQLSNRDRAVSSVAGGLRHAGNQAPQGPQ